jgi:exonuclease III
LPAGSKFVATAWIKSERADVLALQEVVRASDLQKRLFALGFKHFAFTEPTKHRKKTKRRKKFVAIASREPRFTDSPHHNRRDASRIALPWLQRQAAGPHIVWNLV